MSGNQILTTTTRKAPTRESVYDTAIQRLLSEYTSRKYDPEAFYQSELYNRAKEAYTKRADRAMEDTLAKTAYLTGGYNSTYSQAAGQQAYQRYMQEFEDYGAKLADKDYSKFLSQGDTMLKQLNAIGAQSDREDKRYQLALDRYRLQQDRDYDRLVKDRDYELKAAQLEYSKQKDERELAYKQAQLDSKTTAGKTPTDNKTKDPVKDTTVKVSESQAYKDVNTKVTALAKELKSGVSDYAEVILYVDNVISQGHITSEEADYILDINGINPTEYAGVKEGMTRMASLLANAPTNPDMKSATELMVSLGKDSGGNYHFSNIMLAQALKDTATPRQRELAIGRLLSQAPGLSVSQRQLIKAIASDIIRG